MGFCRKLKQKDTGCQDSSLCVETMNGAGNNLTVFHSVGQFGSSPFRVSKEGKYYTNPYMHVLFRTVICWMFGTTFNKIWLNLLN
jgi:hypothetical protein